tara:strand:+ start:5861 stop:7126 length:1266 start_codon:yes stop_codon:yes gene_type:complete
MSAIFAGIGVFVLAISGVPLFIIMALAALVAFSFTGVELSAVAVEIYRISSAPTLLTIPLFTLAGYLMAESGSPKRLLRLADAALGWLPGGVAIVSLVICAFFTAFTGASGVTIIALGGLLFPILKNEGYTEDFSLGLITTSGSLGLLFAPSLPIILYGIVAKVDIDKLFLAGLIPGIFLIVVLSLWSIKNGTARTVTRTFNFKELIAAFKGSFFEALLPVGVLTGIYGGFVTPTEASAMTAFYVLIIECFIYKDLHIFKDVPRVILDSMSLVGGILLILCCALGLTNFMVDEEIPMQILDLMREYISNKWAFLFFLNIFLLVVGAMMDIFSAIIVVVPLITPIAAEFGVDPIHLAIIFLTNLEIGYITPPVGINLFISSFRFKKPVTELYRATFPYLILLIVALAVITYVPQLSLWLVER